MKHYDLLHYDLHFGVAISLSSIYSFLVFHTTYVTFVIPWITSNITNASLILPQKQGPPYQEGKWLLILHNCQFKLKF